MIGAHREQRRSKRQIEVGVFAVDNAEIIDFDCVLLGARVGIEFGGQIADGARALRDAGDHFLVIAPAFFRRQFGEIAVFRIVISAKIMASDSDACFAVVAQGKRINRFRFVAAIVRGVNDVEILGREDDREPAIVGSGAQLRVLIGIVEINRFVINRDADER